MAAENLGIHIFLKYICRQRYLWQRISLRDPEIQRLLLSAESDLRIFCFWSTACSSYTSSVGTVHRDDHGGIHPGIWICRRSDWNGTAAPAVSFLYSSLALFHGTGMGNVDTNLEKQRNLFSEGRHLCRKDVPCCGRISAWNPCRMLYKPMDHQQDPELHKKFLKYIFTIFSCGCHKISDIWYF